MNSQETKTNKQTNKNQDKSTKKALRLDNSEVDLLHFPFIKPWASGRGGEQGDSCEGGSE